MKFDKVFDFVFRFETFGVLMFGILFIFLFMVFDAENETRAETQRLTEACYAQGMVVVRTDAGERCADPRTLVKVK
jgi:energy-converting hydrogenase Eha subunit H